MEMQQHQQHQQQQRQQQQHYSSSPSLSTPPSALSEPGSPTRILNAGRANIEMDEIIVDPSSVARFTIMQQHQPTEPPPNVPLTAAGLPRKKPGRKPGSTVKPKTPADGSSTNADASKQRRPRKPKDPNAPPVQRKRKAAAAEASDATSEMDARSASGPPRQANATELATMRMALDARPTPSDIGFAPSAPKRESGSSSMNMQNLLNDDPQPKPQPAAPTPARQMFDPIRGNYDPIRESMATRDPYGTGPLGSPRAPSQVVNRASASPSIASLVDPQPPTSVVSPLPLASHASYTNPTSQPRFQDPGSMPSSPSNAVRSTPQSMAKPALAEARRAPPPPPAPAPASKPESKTTSFTSMTSIPSAASAAATPAAPAPAQSKKIAAVVQQERESNKKARSSSSSSPKISSLKDALPPVPGSERSILDFGKARPGEEVEAPSISLHIPLQPGESNKYVNFMRMAEERYGWDALHPRLAASRERKARIEAATAALEKTTGAGAGSGRDSADDMDEDILQGSDAGESNVEMGGMGGNGNAPAAAKPARKKRNFKEDEYDKDDGFVDDSEMLWEEQAAASKDGFFVYSGPLIPEVEKPAVSEDRPRRGRGGRGRGSRGGAVRGEGAGRGRGGGGPGSRGGTVRKPRITKLEKEQRDREKAEREKLAQVASKSGTDAAASALLSLVGPGQGATPGMA